MTNSQVAVKAVRNVKTQWDTVRESKNVLVPLTEHNRVPISAIGASEKLSNIVGTKPTCGIASHSIKSSIKY